LAFRPIKPKRLYEEIVEQIRQSMSGGDLKPGDRLMSERDLAERLQVSRPSVREALRLLEVMGFVEIRRGDGAFVRDAQSDEIIKPLAMFLALERSSLLEMFEVRKIFEAATARLAADRATDDELAGMRSAVEAMATSLSEQDSEKGEEHDIGFHHAIAEATHSALLIRLFRTISQEFSRSVSEARRELYLDDKRNPQRLVEQHRRIYRAISDRDVHGAEQAMLEHLGHAERELRKRLA
jgi:GntR family transcriptional repressor for pyruvate dehydrogenase complex